MTKRLLLIVVAFACVVLAHVQRNDAIDINGESCHLRSYPLNEYIETHYSDWPFRPTFHGPGDGGGYWGFWSIRDSMLYLDSVTINAWGRSSIIMDHGDRKHFSVGIPSQEVVLDRSVKHNSFFVFPKTFGPLLADFVSGDLDASCTNIKRGKIFIYAMSLKSGRVLNLSKKEYDKKDYVKALKSMKNKHRNKGERKILRPYQESSSPFISYYYLLDRLQQKQDSADISMYISNPRCDTRFKHFENFFKINAVDAMHASSENGDDLLYTFYVTPKTKKSTFRELVFELHYDLKAQNFSDSPIDAVELYVKSFAAILKNPIFEKWLEKKKVQMDYREIKLEKEERLRINMRSLGRPYECPIDDVLKNTGMSGNYIGSLTFDGIMMPRYKFVLSDKGDVLVTWAVLSSDENFFKINFTDKPVRIGISKDKDSSSAETCEKPFYNYLIIRNDGEIEYGPKSGDM